MNPYEPLEYVEETPRRREQQQNLHPAKADAYTEALIAMMIKYKSENRLDEMWDILDKHKPKYSTQDKEPMKWNPDLTDIKAQLMARGKNAKHS